MNLLTGVSDATGGRHSFQAQFVRIENHIEKVFVQFDSLKMQMEKEDQNGILALLERKIDAFLGKLSSISEGGKSESTEWKIS